MQMKHRKSNTAIVLLVATVVCCVICGTSAAAPVSTNEIAGLGFPVGERLVYKIYWGIISVGTVVMQSEMVKHDGKPMVLLRYRTRTNRFFDHIQKIDDSLESIIDPDSFLPIRYVQKTGRDEDYSNEITTFDHAARKAHWKSETDGSTRDFEIAEDTRDLLSFLYFMRRTELSEKEERTFAIMFDNGIGEAKVKTTEFEQKKVGKFGKIKSLPMTPAISSDNLVLKGGRLQMWITWEGRAVCTRFQVNAPLAKIRLILYQVLGPGDDFWTQTTKKKTKTKDAWLRRISPPHRALPPQ